MMSKKVFFLLLLTSFLNAEKFSYHQYDKLFKKYSEIYNVPFLLLKVIAISENSFLDPNLIKKNKNGTYDIGLFQINTAKITDKELKHIKKEDLKRPEVSTNVAAFILRKIIIEKGYSWDSIGTYHSKTEKYKRKWLKRVKENFKYLKKHEIIDY
jgi:hypothetical protein